ncbi:MAG: DUF1552 domain-containing protein [Pseudomonadota bacterium]
MSSSANFQFSRRTLMRAAGSTLLVPPFLKHAFAQTPATRPNLVLLMQTNGTHQESFWPTGTAWTSPILAKMLADPAVGPKVTLIKGINLNMKGSPQGNGHDWGWHGLYSGVDNIRSGAPAGGGPSVDQILTKQLAFTTPFKNIHCGVIAENHSLINAGRASWPCASAGIQVPCETDIYALYTKLFSSIPAAPATPVTGAGGASGATAAATLRLAQRKSVLDAVATDLTLLAGRLGTSERVKVDSHLTSVRDFENRLTGAMTSTGSVGSTPRPASCSSVKPSMTGVSLKAQADEANADVLMRLFMEFIANAVACNLVGVLTFQFGRGGGHFHYKWLNLPGMPADFHDEAAHADKGGTSVAGTLCTGVAQYYAELVTDLGKRLASFPQANAKTALDNSLVVWGNELATGPHGTNGYPIAFVGGAAGKLKRTGYMVDSGTQIHQRLGCTIQNIMGMPSTGFGAEPACGNFVGLELA